MTPYYDSGGIQIFHGDCREVLPGLGPVDLVFFDPPYGLNIAAWDTKLDGLDVLPVARSLLVPDGVICATCSPHILTAMMSAMPGCRVVTWCKPNLPMRKNLRDFEWSTEFVLFERHGTPYFGKPYGEGGRDYWRIAVENGFLNPDAGRHPARKPIQLLARVVASSCPTGGTTLDPFMGSGTTLRAAKDLARRAIGIEIEERYCEIAARRLDQEVLPGLSVAPFAEQAALA